MFKIGEFSKLCQVSVRMLRYYDAMGLLTPAETDRYTGYRLYSLEQIPILQRIILLRDLDFSIAEMPRILEAWNDQEVKEKLKHKRYELERELVRQQNRLGKLEQALQDIEQGTLEFHYAVSLKTVPSKLVVSLRKIVPSYFSEEELWKELGRYMHRHGIKPTTEDSNNNLTIYHDLEHKDSDVDIEVAAGIPYPCLTDETGFTCREIEAVENMACIMVYGPFENINGAYIDFARWLDNHSQFKMSGLSRQICHKDPWNENDPEKYLTELQVPVERRITTNTPSTL